MDGRQLERTLKVHQRIADAYQDPRFPENGPNTRLLAVTAMWVTGIEQAPVGTRWSRVCELLRLTDYDLRKLIASDAPRWEPPPEHDVHFSLACCDAPMIRRGGSCGHHPAPLRAQVTDPADGTWRIATFCNRHLEHARKAQAAEKELRAAGPLPVPPPNTGGLLPCYLPSWDWTRLYAKHAAYDWQPPAVGIRADDWPVLARVAGHAPPKLDLLPGDGEDAAVAGGPVLRLVPGDC